MAWSRLVALSLLAGALVCAAPAIAQDFGFLFGRPPHGRPRSPRHRAGALPVAPLPVPRPHFAGDTIGAGTASGSTEPVPVGKPQPATTVDQDAKPQAAPASAPAPAPKTNALSGATTAFDPRQPTADAACPGRLSADAVGAEAVTIGPQPDARCTVVQAVRLSALKLGDGATVTFPDKPTIACETADTFAHYVRELLVPLAKGSYGSPIDAVWTGPGLECRSRDHVFGAKLSAHGQGLAIDIAQLRLADGRKLDVGVPATATDQAFETAARAAACGYFHTVLGPGTDSYHRTHWHFDLEQRGRTGNDKYCR